MKSIISSRRAHKKAAAQDAARTDQISRESVFGHREWRDDAIVIRERRRMSVINGNGNGARHGKANTYPREEVGPGETSARRLRMHVICMYVLLHKSQFRVVSRHYTGIVAEGRTRAKCARARA